jgi:hypothetical protein
VIAWTPARSFGQADDRDGLTENHKVIRRGFLHRADNLARHVDPMCGQAAANFFRHQTHDMPNFQSGLCGGVSVEPHDHILGIADAKIIHDDTAETADGADHTGSADAAVLFTLPRRGRSTGTADSLIQRLTDCRASRSGQKCGGAGEEPQNSSSDQGTRIVHVQALFASFA